MAYLSVFPIDGAMRANLMVYRDMTDPWLPEFRKAPEAAMRALMPGLGRMMGAFKVATPIKIRPADLCVTEGHLQPGIVLVGDAFSTSCPAAGTGTTKCSPMSGVSVTSTSRHGSQPTAWTRTRFRNFTTIPKKSPARRAAWPRPTIFARSRSTTACRGAPGAGRVSPSGSVRAHGDRSARDSRPGPPAAMAMSQRANNRGTAG